MSLAKQLKAAAKDLDNTIKAQAKLEAEAQKARENLNEVQNQRAALSDMKTFRSRLAAGTTIDDMAEEASILDNKIDFAEMNVQAYNDMLEVAREAVTIAQRKVAELEAAEHDEAAHDALVNFIDLFKQSAAVLDSVLENANEMSARVGHLKSYKRYTEPAPGVIPMTDEEKTLQNRVGNYRALVNTWRHFERTMINELQMKASTLEIEAPPNRPGTPKRKVDPGLEAAEAAAREAQRMV